MRRFSLIVFLICSANSGCALVGATVQSISDVPSYWAAKSNVKAELYEQKRQDHLAVAKVKLEDYQDETEALKISRELLIEKRRIERQRDLAYLENEKAHLLAEAEAGIEASRPQYDHKLNTQLGLSFDQQVRVGQLQVNIDELEKRMKSWKQQQQAALEKYEEDKNAYEERQKNSETAGLSGSQIIGCDRPAHEKIAGIEAPPQLEILPTEIPLMMPVTLALEMKQPTIEQAAIRRIPYAGLEQCEETAGVEPSCTNTACTGCPDCAPVLRPCPPFVEDSR